MGRQTPFTKVQIAGKTTEEVVSEVNRMQDRMVEALRVLRHSPQAVVTAKGSIVAASGDGQPVEHKASATDGLPLLTDSTQTTGLNYAALSLAAAVTGVLPIANGGTNSSAALTNGKLMIASGSAIVEGPAGTTTTVLHGNAAGNPTYSGVSLTADTTANQGTTTTVLHGNGAGQPSFATIVNADITSVDAGKITTGTLPIARGGTNSATAMSGNSIMISNGSAIVQGAAGTTTTLLHGNAAGSPTYSAVSLTADITGTLAEGNGGTNQSTYAQGDVLYASAANTLARLAKGTSGQLLQISATIPAWTGETAYTAPTLAGTWANSGGGNAGAGYIKDATGRVYLKGLVTGGTVNTNIFTLPAGYRPSANRTFSPGANGAFGQIAVTSAGAVNQQNSASATNTSLDGVEFDTI